MTLILAVLVFFRRG